MEFTYLQSAFIYVISVLIFAVSAGIYKKRSRQSVLILGMIPLLFIGTFRDSVGTDFENYFSIYKNYGNYNIGDFLLLGNYEVGYFLLNKIGHIFDSFNVVLFFSTFLVLIVPVWTIRDEENISLPAFIVLYSSVFLFSFNGIRQGIAVAIMFNALYYLFKDKNIVKFILKTMLASSFHMTGFILLPTLIFIIPKGKLTSRIIYFSAVFAIVFVALNPYATIKLLTSIPLFSKYEFYKEINQSSNYSFYLKLFIFLLLFSFRNYFYRLSQVTKIYMTFVFLDLAFAFLGFNMVSVKRMAEYFHIFPLILLSMVHLVFKRPDRLVVHSLVIIYGLLMIVLYFWVFELADIFPYRILL